jgi:hypothetical protein
MHGPTNSLHNIRHLLVVKPSSGLKCPERSEPLGFGHLRVFLIIPFIYAGFRDLVFSTGIGHSIEKSSKSEREKKKL